MFWWNGCDVWARYQIFYRFFPREFLRYDLSQAFWSPEIVSTPRPRLEKPTLFSQNTGTFKFWEKKYPYFFSSTCFNPMWDRIKIWMII